MGPKELCSSEPAPKEEAIVVVFRRHTFLPLDNCLYALRPTMAHLTCSTLHRFLERSGISRLPEAGGDRKPRQRFAPYRIDCFHIDLAKVSTAAGKLRLCVGIDCTGKFVFVRLVESVEKMGAAGLL